MVVLGGVAVSYERGTPVGQACCPRACPVSRLLLLPVHSRHSRHSACAVRLIPTRGALFPRGGPVQVPVLTCAEAPRRHSGDSRNTCDRVLERFSRLQATKTMQQCQSLTVSYRHCQLLSLFHYYVTLKQKLPAENIDAADAEHPECNRFCACGIFFFFFTLVTGP